MKTFKHSKYRVKVGELHLRGTCVCRTGPGRCLVPPDTWIGAQILGVWSCQEHLEENIVRFIRGHSEESNSIYYEQ
jgi:hypothetical protein